MTYISRELGIIDAGNTAVLTGGALLGASGSWTGNWIDTTQYELASTSILGDFSDGGTLWFDVAHDDGQVYSSAVPRNVGNPSFDIPHTFLLVEKWLRVRYVNGPVAQNTSGTYFSIQTRLHKTQPADISQVPRDELRFSTESRPARIANDFNIDRNQGNIEFSKSRRKFGKNISVATGAFETIWEGADLGGPAIYVFPSAATTVRVKSGGNAADTIAGTGARKVIINGLDQNWNEVEEEISLAGASASASTTTTFIRINRVEVSEVGTGKTNAGNIVIENTGATLNLAYLRAGEAVTNQAIVSIPAGYTAYVRRVKVSVGQSNSADIRFFHTLNNTIANHNVTHYEWGVQDFSGAQEFIFDTYLKIGEKADLFAEAQRITGSGTATVSFDFDYILEKN